MTGAAFSVRELTLPEVRDVYRRYLTQDFPDDERKPLSRIERAMARGEYRCCGAVDGSGVLAYAFLMCVRHAGQALCLLDYLAVRRELRGGGLGSAFLAALRGGVLAGMDCVLAEADNPAWARNDSERKDWERRVRFYLRNGFRDTGAEANTFGVEYSILELPLAEVHTAEEVRKLYEALYRSQLPAKMYEEMIHTRVKGAERYAGGV